MLFKDFISSQYEISNTIKRLDVMKSFIVNGRFPKQSKD